ncbi:MAG: DUF4339 domain-containing protein [Armatimonadota bacterium]
MHIQRQSWYVSRAGQVYGPVPLEHLRAWAQQGQLAPTDAVAPAGSTQWQPASSVAELAPCFARAPGGPKRPTGITVIAWMGIVLGILGLCGLGGTVMMLAGADAIPGMREAWNQVGLSRTYLTASLAMGLISVVLMVAAGAGLLGCREWARKLFFLLAAYRIAMGIVDIGWLLSETQSAQLIMQGILGTTLGVAFVIVGSIYLSRPHIAHHFN